jgi:hypothetical protein
VKVRMLVMVLTFSGMMLMIVGLSNHTTTESGGIEQFMYPFWSFAAAIGGSILVTAGLSYLTYVRHPEEKPNVIDDIVMMVVDRLRSDEKVEPSAEVKTSPETQVESTQAMSPTVGDRSEWELVLRLLGGDERVMFKSLVDAGGEAYQKDLVAKTQMSDTKASRVIDRLEEKELVARERRGMSNLIRIIVRQTA